MEVQLSTLYYALDDDSWNTLIGEFKLLEKITSADVVALVGGIMKDGLEPRADFLDIFPGTWACAENGETEDDEIDGNLYRVQSYVLTYDGQIITSVTWNRAIVAFIYDGEDGQGHPDWGNGYVRRGDVVTDEDRTGGDGPPEWVVTLLEGKCGDLPTISDEDVCDSLAEEESE